MANGLSLNEGQKSRERVSEMEEDGTQSSRRNNLDQLGPKELRAQLSIGKATSYYTSPIIISYLSDINYEEVVNETSSIRKDGDKVEEEVNSDMKLVEETPSAWQGATNFNQ